MRILPILFLCFSGTNLLAATLTYAPLNRLTRADYGNGIVIAYTYDDAGNRTSRTITNSTKTITVTVPSGGGFVSGGGLKQVGDAVNLEATPTAGYQFDYWKENGAIIGYQNPLVFTVSISRDLEAYFSALGSYNAVIASYHLDPQTDGAPTADPDGDGLMNLLEYALGSDPTVAGQPLQSLPRIETTDDGVRSFVFEVDYRASATDFVAIKVEYSTDLATWNGAVHGVDGVQLSTVSVDATKDRLRFKIPATAPNMFVRLRVTKPNEE